MSTPFLDFDCWIVGWASLPNFPLPFAEYDLTFLRQVVVFEVFSVFILVLDGLPNVQIVRGSLRALLAG
jgi:hypothetical protein